MINSFYSRLFHTTPGKHKPLWIGAFTAWLLTGAITAWLSRDNSTQRTYQNYLAKGIAQQMDLYWQRHRSLPHAMTFAAMVASARQDWPAEVAKIPVFYQPIADEQQATDTNAFFVWYQELHQQELKLYLFRQQPEGFTFTELTEQ